jgi:hypothetical protein
MADTQTLRGLTIVRFHSADHAAAKRWYTELLGIEPYYDIQQKNRNRNARKTRPRRRVLLQFNTGREAVLATWDICS